MNGCLKNEKINQWMSFEINVERFLEKNKSIFNKISNLIKINFDFQTSFG